MTTSKISNTKIWLAVVVAALGYFVDVFDLLLLNIVRMPSLKELGLEGDLLIDAGVFILNWQMIGMLLGGFLWGVIGDKRGRVQVLFGSIRLYSLASLGCGFVQTLDQYALLRFIGGIGLAGEIGSGITLVAELMPIKSRGIATAFVAGIGVSGTIGASIVSELVHWRTAYIIGGAMGLSLLVLRLLVHESGLFSSLCKETNVRRGDIKMLFQSWERFTRYCWIILIGLPVWFTAAIIFTFSPEIARALEVQGTVNVSTVFLWATLCMAVGDVASGLLSQVLKSRRTAIAFYFLGYIVVLTLLLSSHGLSLSQFYGLVMMQGFFIGFWAVFLSSATEQFGTNLRATVTTTVPNLVRGLVIPTTLLFQFLRPGMGVVGSAQLVGLLVLTLSCIGLAKMRETFGIDLNYVEE